MDWRTFWITFYALLPQDAKTVLVYLVLCSGLICHLTTVHGSLSSSSPWINPLECREPCWQGPAANLALQRVNHYVYERHHLLSVRAAPLDPDLALRLRELGIGYHLASRRSCRAGAKKQRKIGVITGFVGGLSSHHQVGANFDNLTTVVPCTGKTHNKQSRPSDKSLKMLFLNIQSVRNKTIEVHDLIVDRQLDIIVLVETWLYDSGDETFITEMTPRGYICRSFPRAGRRGGGICVILRDTLIGSTKCLPLLYKSFEAIDIQVSCDSTTISIIGLYRPPPSRKNCLTNRMFFEDFSKLLSDFGNAHREFCIVGDFNFHFDNTINCEVVRLKSLLSDHSLMQLTDRPTHSRGHILDWFVVQCEGHCSLHAVEDLALSDHSALIGCIELSRPSRPKRSVTSRKLRAIDHAAFRADVSSLTETVATDAEVPVSQLVDTYNEGLTHILDKHAPLATRCVTNRFCPMAD